MIAWNPPEKKDKPRPCPTCGGGGAVPETVYGTVTRDMALDACEPELEGQPIPIGEDWLPCPDCNRGEHDDEENDDRDDRPF
jgi:hypothetical protein